MGRPRGVHLRCKRYAGKHFVQRTWFGYIYDLNINDFHVLELKYSKFPTLYKLCFSRLQKDIRSR